MSAETTALLLSSAARVSTYAATFGVVGAAGAQVVVGRAYRQAGVNDTKAVDKRVLRLALWGAFLLVVGAAWRLYAQAYEIFGIDEGVTWQAVRAIVYDTTWGFGWRIQATAAIVIVVVLASSRLRVGFASRAAVPSAMASVAVLPLTGHAVSEGGVPWLTVGLQSLHVAGAGLWIGTLGVTLYLTRSSVLRVDDPQLVFRYAIDTFSTLAVTVVGLLALSGVITGAIYLERIADLWATTYGQVLVLKVGLFAAIGALGAYNWRRLRPQLDHADAAPRLRRIAGFETGMGVLVLVVTAVLVVLPLGH